MLYRLLTAFCLCLAVVGCDKDQKTKPLLVMISPDNPPFEFKETGAGGAQLLGFDVDIINELGRQLGRPIEIVEAEFGAIIPSLQSGRVDMAISELSPSEERKKSVDFSEPYYINKSAFLVPASSPIASEQDLAGKAIGVQMGSTNEVRAKAWAEQFPNLTIVALGKVGELVQELKNGRVDVIMVGARVCQNIADSTPGFKVVHPNIEGGEIAIAFPKGSPLVESANKALKQMKSFIKSTEAKWIKS